MWIEAMNEQRVTEVLHTIAREAVPDDLDLWPDIRAQVETIHTARRDGRMAAPRPVQRITSKAWAVGVAILVLGGLIFMPGVRTSVVEILGIMSIVSRDSTPTTSLTVTASATVPDTAFTGTPPSAPRSPTPAPQSEPGGQPLSFEDTPYPADAAD